jgi:PAS domain S-box-containing protein
MSLPRRPQGNGKPVLLAGRKRKKSASFLDEAPVPYLLLDPSGAIVEANPPAARLLGREQAGLQRLPLRAFVCEADREKFDRHLYQSLGGGKNASTELKLDVSGTPLVELISLSCVASRSRKLLLHMIIHERPTNGIGSPAVGIVAKEIQNLKPEGDLGVLELGDIIDVPAFQKLMNDFYAVSHFPMSIVDMKGRVLVGVGWQDICTKFHRVNPETCKLCLESDTQLSAGVARGEFRQYRCKNSLWDIATPIVVAGRQVGNVFSGQFFFDDETVDRETFRAQARQYRFDEEQYLGALDRVPRLSRRTVEDGMAFLLKLADMLSQLGYSNAQLARLLAERDRLTASLHEEKERLKRAQEIAHLGSWELDVDSGSVTWSDESYRIFGLEPQQTVVSYGTFLDHVHPDDRAAVDAAYTRSLRENQDSYDIEHRVVNASTGEICFVHERCHHTRDDSGNIVRSVGMVHDITEQKRAEMELRESRMKYQALIETTADFIWEIDAQGRYTYCSPQIDKLLGLKPEDMIGKSPFGTVPAELQDSTRETLSALLASPRAFSGLETSALDSGGRVVCLETSGVPFFDKDGAFAGFRGISRDVTERKHADEALRSSEERLHLALKAARAGAWDWNMATGTSAISDSYRELFGIPPGQPFSYDSWLASLHPEDRERCRAYGEAFFGSKDSLEWDLEFRINTPHLGIRWHHATGTVQRDENGRPQRFIGVSTDITDRKRIEESEERLKALMNHNPSLVFLKDESGRYVYLNEAYEKQFAHTKEWFGKTDFDFWPRESAKLFRANDAEVLKSGRTQQVLEDLTDLDGKRHCWLAYKFPFTDSKGNRYLGGIGIDAIDRVRAEEAVRDQQSRLTLAMEAGQLVPYEIDLTTGEVMGSPQLFKAFGLRPTPEVHHRTQWRSFIHEDDREGLSASVERAAATGKEHHYEYRLHHSDGTIHWHETHGMVLADEQGHRRRLVGFLRDITGRKQAEEAVAAAQRQVQSIIENTPAIVYALDLGERFIMANSALAQVLNTTPEQMIGKRRNEFMPKEDADWHEANDRKVFEAGEAMEFEEYSQLKDRSITWLTSKFPLRDAQGRIYAVGGISSDVSERKQVEEALRRSQKTLHDLIEGSPFGTYLVDSQFRIAMMNASSQESAFRNVRPLIGRDFSEAMRILWPEAVASQIIGHFRHTLETGEPYYSPRFINLRRDIAAVESYEWELHRMTLPDGQNGVICYYYDSTKLQEANEALRVSEARFRLAIEHSQLMAWQCDTAMRFTWIYNSHFGIPDVDMLGKAPTKLENERGMAEFIAHGAEVLQRGKGVRKTIRYVHANGQEKYFDQQIEIVPNPDGGTAGLIGISLDVTERVLAEQRLHKSEESFRLMIGHSGEPMLLVDQSGTIDCISKNAAEQLGFQESELVGTSVDRFLDWSGKLDLTMRLQDFQRHAPSPAKGVLRIRRKDGSWCWLDVQASFVNYGQRPEKYLLKFEMINANISR